MRKTSGTRADVRPRRDRPRTLRDLPVLPTELRSHRPIVYNLPTSRCVRLSLCQNCSPWSAEPWHQALNTPPLLSANHLPQLLTEASRYGLPRDILQNINITYEGEAIRTTTTPGKAS